MFINKTAAALITCFRCKSFNVELTFDLVLLVCQFAILFATVLENIDLYQDTWHFSVNTHLPAVSSSLVHYSAFSRATIIDVGTSVGH